MAKPAKSARPSTPAITDELDRALAALRAGQLGEALEALLTAWRAAPAAELAAAIEHVGAQIDRGLPALAEGKAGLAEWLEVASTREAIHVGRLLAALPDQFVRMRPRLDALAELPADPRVSSALLALDIGTSAQSSGPLYTSIFTMLDAIGDGRALPTLKKRLPRYRKELDHTLRERVATRVEKLVAKLAPPPKLSAKDAKLVAAIVKVKPPSAAKPATPAAKPAGAKSDAALLEAVYESPHDDAARSVYADALLERADPRGELIALQLASHARLPTDAEDKRISELLREHARKWSAPLDSVVNPSTIRFARGFLDSCVVKQRAGKLAGHPVWSTVRELECHDLDVITHPVMRALRRVSVTPSELSELAAHPTPLPFDTAIGRWLDGRASAWDGLSAEEPDEIRGALAVGALTKLTGLSIDMWTGVDAWQHLPGSKLAGQLERLDIALYGWGDKRGVGTWMPFVRALPKVRRVTIRQGYEGKRVTAVLERTSDGWDGALQVNRYDLDDHVKFLLEGAASIVKQLRVELVGKERFAAAKLQPTVDAAKKFVAGATMHGERVRPAEV